MGDVVYDFYRAFNSSGGFAAWVSVGLTLWIVCIAMKWRDEARTKTSAEVATRCLIHVLELDKYVRAQTERCLRARKQVGMAHLPFGIWNDVRPKQEALTRAVDEAEAHLPEIADQLKEFRDLVDEFRLAQLSSKFDEAKVPEFDGLVSDLKEALHRAARLEE